MARKKAAEEKIAGQGAQRPEESLEELSKLSKEALLIKLGQLISENAALRQKARLAAETTDAFRTATRRYLTQPFEDTMRDYED